MWLQAQRSKRLVTNVCLIKDKVLGCCTCMQRIIGKPESLDLLFNCILFKNYTCLFKLGRQLFASFLFSKFSSTSFRYWSHFWIITTTGSLPSFSYLLLILKARSSSKHCIQVFLLFPPLKFFSTCL